MTAESRPCATRCSSAAIALAFFFVAMSPSSSMKFCSATQPSVSRAVISCGAPADHKLTVFDASMNDRFGHSVSMDGDIVVLGAPFDDGSCPADTGCNSGSIYIFRYIAEAEVWKEEARLVALDAARGDEFGNSVATSGNVAVVGAHRDDDMGSNTGAGYVFRWTGDAWNLEQKLVPSDAAANDFFGNAVSIDGNIAVVGAFADDCEDESSNCGSAYIFRHDGVRWNQDKKLTALDTAAGAFFGISVAINGNFVVVGARNTTCEGVLCGAAYVYQFDGGIWTEEAKLTAGSDGNFDSFGGSVGISGDVVVVGAGKTACGNGATDCGAAYTFRRKPETSTWSLEQALAPADITTGDAFGHSVSIDGSFAVVGSWHDDDFGSSSGSAYAFRYDEIAARWVQARKLSASDGLAEDSFGVSVSVHGDSIVAGASAAANNDGAAGAAYVFGLFGDDCSGDGTADVCELRMNDCNTNGIPDRCEISASSTAPGGPYFCLADCSADCNGDGIPDECGTPITCDIAELQRIVAFDPMPDDRFGSSVVVNDTVMAIAARADLGFSPDVGVVYVFRRDPNSQSWTFEQKVGASDGAAYDNFGSSLTIEGNTLYAASIRKHTIYVFRFDENARVWREHSQIRAPSLQDDDFGRSMSVFDDALLVGTTSSWAYIIRHDGNAWVNQGRLTMEVGSDRNFGSSVALGSNFALVGVPYHEVSGSVSVFGFNANESQWEKVQELTAPDVPWNQGFGFSLSLDNRLLVVGAPYAGCNTPANVCQPGAAYVFRLNADSTMWVFEQKILPSDSAVADRFGWSVAIHGTTIVVGATEDPGEHSPNETGAGSAYVFEYSPATKKWEQTRRLALSDGASNDEFGARVSTDGNVVAIGARNTDHTGTVDAGSVHIFDLRHTDNDCNTQADVCDCQELGPANEPTSSSHAANPKNRYVSVVSTDSGVETGLQVTLVESAAFPEAAGLTWWVGPAVGYCEGSPDRNPPCISVGGIPSSTFHSAGLQCAKHCFDWAALDGPLHIGDPNVVPDAIYEVRVVPCECEPRFLGTPDNSIRIATSQWGDTVATCEACPCTEPNGTVDIADCNAVVARFVNATCAPLTTRVDLVPAIPDRRIDIIDVLACIQSFQGLAYDLPAPTACE